MDFLQHTCRAYLTIRPRRELTVAELCQMSQRAFVRCFAEWTELAEQVQAAEGRLGALPLWSEYIRCYRDAAARLRQDPAPVRPGKTLFGYLGKLAGLPLGPGPTVEQIQKMHAPKLLAHIKYCLDVEHQLQQTPEYVAFVHACLQLSIVTAPRESLESAERLIQGLLGSLSGQ